MGRCGVSRRGTGAARMKAKAAVILILMKSTSIIAAPRKCGAHRRRAGAARTRAKDASEFYIKMSTPHTLLIRYIFIFRHLSLPILGLYSHLNILFSLQTFSLPAFLVDFPNF